jgi:adenylate cyclase
MPLEIERKFLTNDRWHHVTKPEGQYYRQGYLLSDPLKTIRVRMTPDKGFLTIKGPTQGATRAEYEYEIPIAEAQELLDHFCTSELSKIRYKIPNHGHVWEVDEFLGENQGLIVAEIELGAENEPFLTPEWIGMEVTGDKRYYNSSLTVAPFAQWKVTEELT